MKLVPLQIKTTHFIDTMIDFVEDPKKNLIFFALVLAPALKECTVCKGGDRKGARRRGRCVYNGR